MVQGNDGGRAEAEQIVALAGFPPWVSPCLALRVWTLQGCRCVWFKGWTAFSVRTQGDL